MLRGRTGAVGEGGGYILDGDRVPRVTEIVALARLRAPWQETDPETAEERLRVLAALGPMGRHIHAVMASYPETAPCPPGVCSGECSAYRDQFRTFMDVYRPKFLARETPVFSRTHAYGGTPDWIALIGGTTLVGDIKTGFPHPQVALQLAAYRHAEFFVDSGTEMSIPRCSGGVVLSLWPDHFELRDVRCDEEVFQAFLRLREFHEYKRDLQDATVGGIRPAP